MWRSIFETLRWALYALTAVAVFLLLAIVVGRDWRMSDR